MSYRLRFLEEALLDGQIIFMMYRSENLAAADKFERAVTAAANRVVENPFLYQRQSDGYRHCQLHRFPYRLVYTMDGEQVLVVALTHTSREPGWWLPRSGA